MNNKYKISTISVLFAVQIVLLILKLFKIIDWNWLIIFTPIWIIYVLPLAVGIYFILYALCYNIKERIFKNNG